MITPTHPFPDVAELLPHRGTMLLLDRVTGFTTDTATVQATPDAGAWYADAEGCMPAWIGLELMAQAVGVHVGLAHHYQGLPQKAGVLLGTRSYRSAAACFPAGTPLMVHAAMAFRDPSGLGSYECTISQPGNPVPLAEATLKVFEPQDFHAFVQENPA